jgi:hypothetical protein
MHSVPVHPKKISFPRKLIKMGVSNVENSIFYPGNPKKVSEAMKKVSERLGNLFGSVFHNTDIF